MLSAFLFLIGFICYRQECCLFSGALPVAGLTGKLAVPVVALILSLIGYSSHLGSGILALAYAAVIDSRTYGAVMNTTGIISGHVGHAPTVNAYAGIVKTNSAVPFSVFINQVVVYATKSFKNSSSLADVFFAGYRYAESTCVVGLTDVILLIAGNREGYETDLEVSA